MSEYQFKKKIDEMIYKNVYKKFQDENIKQFKILIDKFAYLLIKQSTWFKDERAYLLMIEDSEADEIIYNNPTKIFDLLDKNILIYDENKKFRDLALNYDILIYFWKLFISYELYKKDLRSTDFTYYYISDSDTDKDYGINSDFEFEVNDEDSDIGDDY